MSCRRKASPAARARPCASSTGGRRGEEIAGRHSYAPPKNMAVAHGIRPPLRFASQTTSPPLDGGEEAPAAGPGFLPLPHECGGEVVCEANRSGGIRPYAIVFAARGSV